MHSALEPTFVRCYSNNGQIVAVPRLSAMCHKRTHALQQNCIDIRSPRRPLVASAEKKIDPNLDRVDWTNVDLLLVIATITLNIQNIGVAERQPHVF